MLCCAVLCAGGAGAVCLYHYNLKEQKHQDASKNQSRDDLTYIFVFIK